MINNIEIKTQSGRTFFVSIDKDAPNLCHIFARDYAANRVLSEKSLHTAPDHLSAITRIQEVDTGLPHLSDEEKGLLKIVHGPYFGRYGTFSFDQKKDLRIFRKKLLEDVVAAGYNVSFDDDDRQTMLLTMSEITGMLERCMTCYTMFRSSINVGSGRVSLVFDPSITPHCEMKLYDLDHPTAWIDRTDMTLRSFPMNSAGFLQFIKELVPVKNEQMSELMCENTVQEPDKCISQNTTQVSQNTTQVSQNTTQVSATQRKKRGRGKVATSEFFR